MRANAETWEWVRDYFVLAEFDSPDLPGSGAKMHDEFVRALADLRHRVGFPLMVNSGFRTPRRNQGVGGAANSAHLRGWAADLAINSGQDRFKVLNHAVGMGFRRIGVGADIIHLDMDPNLPQDMVWVY